MYHKHPILQEPDAALRNARLTALRIFRRGLESICEILGVPIPDRM